MSTLNRSEKRLYNPPYKYWTAIKLKQYSLYKNPVHQHNLLHDLHDPPIHEHTCAVGLVPKLESARTQRPIPSEPSDHQQEMSILRCNLQDKVSTRVTLANETFRQASPEYRSNPRCSRSDGWRHARDIYKRRNATTPWRTMHWLWIIYGCDRNASAILRRTINRKSITAAWS